MTTGSKTANRYEIKSGSVVADVADAVEEMVEGINAFKAKYNGEHQKLLADLATERKEREDLELRLQRIGVKGAADRTGAIDAERKALGGWARNGAGSPNSDWSHAEELKAMSIGSDPDGGYLVLPEMSSTMTTRLRDLSPMRRLARIQLLPAGDAFEEPDDRDEAAAGWVGEKEARNETDTPDLGLMRFELDEMYAKPKVTQRLLDDAKFDVGTWLENKITEKFGRAEGAAFVTGDGLKKPRGFLDYSTSTAVDFTRTAGSLQYFPSGHASSWASSNPADVLKTLMWGLRTPYRTGAAWLMNSATAKGIDQFKDTTGQYLWRDSLVSGTPPTLLGYPVEIDENMPDIGANTFPIAFGNFRMGYMIVDRPGMKLLRDPYTERPHVLFYTTKRVGGGVTDDNAIKLLKIATS